jgi:hypothetical protein
MLMSSSQVAVRCVRASFVPRISGSLFAFRFRSRPQCEDMIRSFSFAPHCRTSGSLQTLACSLAFSFSLLVRSLLFYTLLSITKSTACLNMNIGDNDQDPSTVKRSCRVHRKSRKGCANCKARRVKVPQTNYSDCICICNAACRPFLG